MLPTEARSLARSTRTVDGWFFASGLFALLDEAQKAAAIEGNLFEIGAHHGKSTVMLGRMARSGESLGVCDLFGSQAENVSGSGRGDRAVFEENMHRLAPEVGVRVFEKSSAELSPADVGTCRFFHIDGGHLASEALGDLRLADGTVTSAGLIAIDDPFHAEWPGVTEAIFSFLDENREWSTVALACNKQILARREHAALYRAALERDWTRYLNRHVFHHKTLPVGRDEALIFYIPARWRSQGLVERLAALHWWQGAIRNEVRQRLARPS